MSLVQRILNWFKEKFFPSKDTFFGIDIYRAADGTLYLFPAVGGGDEGPVYTLSELTVLAPPYTHEMVGQTILALLRTWNNVKPPDDPPEEDFWAAVPGCHSFRAFQSRHQMIEVSVERKELFMHYMARDEDQGYTQLNGNVKLSASFCPNMPRLAWKMGRAVWQIFQLAEVMDPLPPPVSEAKK